MHTRDPSGSRLEGWITLAALAQVTQRLRMGTLITRIRAAPGLSVSVSFCLVAQRVR